VIPTIFWLFLITSPSLHEKILYRYFVALVLCFTIKVLSHFAELDFPASYRTQNKH